MRKCWGFSVAEQGSKVLNLGRMKYLSSPRPPFWLLPPKGLGTLEVAGGRELLPDPSLWSIWLRRPLLDRTSVRIT